MPAGETNVPDSETIELTRAELELVRTGLRLLLSSEDDSDEIEQLKKLIARLPA